MNVSEAFSVHFIGSGIIERAKLMALTVSIEGYLNNPNKGYIDTHKKINSNEKIKEISFGILEAMPELDSNATQSIKIYIENTLKQSLNT